jgi:hypothetical protein
MKKLKSDLKSYIGGSVMLGVGGMALDGMGYGSITSKTITPPANMMGAVGSAMMGSYVIKQLSPKKRRK